MNPFIDANVIIKAFTRNADTEKCRSVLREPFVTNALCLIEVQHGISIIKKDKIYAARCIRSLFKPIADVVEVDKNLLFEATKRAHCNLNIFDLIHYTTALLNECSHIISYDKDFDNLEIKRIEP